jgi:hypothetical protein
MIKTRVPAPHFRDIHSVVELYVGIFRRDALAYYPQSRLERVAPTGLSDVRSGPNFHLIEDPNESDGAIDVVMFGARYRLSPREGTRFTTHDRRMLRAIGAVLSMRYHSVFQTHRSPRLELFGGGSEDHHVAAFIDPSAYVPDSARPSRIASTIQTLRTTALSTFENRRVSTGALLLGSSDLNGPIVPTSPHALTYGVELTSLKSVHRLCDGRRTLFLVDTDGRLADIIDVESWAAQVPDGDSTEIPCARAYTAHARATRTGGHVCLVLSPNQEIKLFEQGMQTFAFAHGRWRILDPASKFETWSTAVARPRLARVLFQTALDLAESRHGGLLVVVEDPSAAVGRLVAPHDALSRDATDGPPPEFTPGDPLAKRALHYLARGRDVTDLAPSVLEALGGLDGALVTDRNGGLLAFGAILRHDTSSLPGPITAEGARTTAALVASCFGPVLKVSEDGVISCFLDGSRIWDL